MDAGEMLKRVLDQNDKLIEALTKTSPVEVIKALNPAPTAPTFTTDIYPEPSSRTEPTDIWGDPNIPTDRLIPSAAHWTTPDTPPPPSLSSPSPSPDYHDTPAEA